MCATESQGIANGSQVPFTVSARNQAYPALATWTEAGGTGTPFGPPIAGGISVTGDAAAGTVTVSWAPFDGNGDAIGGYFVQRLADGQTAVPSGPQACSVTSPAPGDVVAPASGGSVAEVVQVGPDASSVQFTGTVTESTRLLLRRVGIQQGRPASNTEVAGIVVRPAPGTITGVVESDGLDEPGDVGPLHRPGRLGRAPPADRRGRRRRQRQVGAAGRASGEPAGSAPC